MKALVFYGPGDIRLENCTIPEAGYGEILIRVRAAGVCGTDLRIFNGTKAIKTPRIIGHEFAGDVVMVGNGVTEFVPGDRVAVYPVISCSACDACRQGRTNICLNRITLGYELDGGFAEYVLIPAVAVERGNVSKLPGNISYEEGAVSETLAAVYNGCKRANVKAGDSVLVVGAGPVGLMHIQLAKAHGAELIIVSEPQNEKRAKARLLGAHAAVDPVNENLRERINQMTFGKGMDAVIIAVGIPKVIEESLEYVKKGGSYVIFAGCQTGSRITIDPNLIHYREVTLTGSSAANPEYQREMLRMVAEGQIDLKAVISNVLPAERWKEAFAMKATYDGFKSVLVF